MQDYLLIHEGETLSLLFAEQPEPFLLEFEVYNLYELSVGQESKKTRISRKSTIFSL